MEGVLSYAEVYVNGIFVTSHKGEAPFVADITAPVKYNYENRIVIKADAALRPEYGSGTRGPLTLFGGVHRDAVFMICDGRDIRDVCVRTVREGNKSLITADAELYDYYPDTEPWASLRRARWLARLCACTAKCRRPSIGSPTIP